MTHKPGNVPIACNQIRNKNSFLDIWEREAHNLEWFKPWKSTLLWQEPFAHWFAGGELNASYLCLDVHIKAGKSDKPALVWCNEEGQAKEWTYKELYNEVNRYAYVLEKLGVGKGDRVIVYMPMIPDTLAVLLALARLGAPHAVVFSGFSSVALKQRINNLQARFVITADYTVRRGKYTRLKEIVDQALKEQTTVEKVLVVQRGQTAPPLMEERDVLYQRVRPEQKVYRKPESVESNHPLFVLYTSGTTGSAKGIVHSTGGYLTHCYATFKWAFEPSSHSRYWCTADIGWITGHSYGVYAPLMHGLTMFMFEGAPDFPDAGIWWQLIEQYKVSIFYTSPTALRLAIQAGNEWPDRHDLSSLKTLATVGEPISAQVWSWFYKQIGKEKCPVIDTWWQTETGGFMIAPQAGNELSLLKPGSATRPMPGICATIVDAAGDVVAPEVKGYLVITQPWPGMALGVYGDPQRFRDTYWSKFAHSGKAGLYYTGDYAVQDQDGYFWMLGRADEVLNLSGHCIGTAEIESAALTHKAVAEVAALGLPDPIRGEQAILFVALKHDAVQTATLYEEINEAIKKHIGAFVKPGAIYFIQQLPKTRSGKIMRRLLKDILEQKTLGDSTTLEDGVSLQEIEAHYGALKAQLPSVLSL